MRHLVVFLSLALVGCASKAGERRPGDDKQLHVTVSGLNTGEAFAGFFNGLDSSVSSLPFSPGERITVHLRRDAVGLATNVPAGLDYGGPLRDALSVSGTYVGGTPGWVTLDRDGRRLSIPVAQVLAIETTSPQVTTTRPG